MTEDEDETAAKPVARRGRPRGLRLTQETKERIRQTQIGKRHSPESIERMRQARLRFYRQQREQEEEAAHAPD